MSEPPVPRRQTRPRWLDVRIMGGVLLLVASVVIGAKVIGASSHTSPVWAASRDLASGTVLDADDLVAVDVNLGDHGGAYVDASSSLAGKVLSVPIHLGELLPVQAIATVDDKRVVSVPVSPDRMAPDIRHGSMVDLYLVDANHSVTSDAAATTLQQAGVTVQHVTAPSSGGLSGVTLSQYQVALLLSPADADALVKALPGRETLLVARSTGQ